MDKLIKVSPQLHRIASQLAGDFDVLVVGGSVRNALMARDPKQRFAKALESEKTDTDVVVVGGTLEQVQSAFKRFVPIRPKVVSNAPVFKAKIGREWMDIAVARIEKLRPEAGSMGQQNQFEFETGPHITLLMDLERRDFTVNAMAWHITKGVLIDPFNGARDLKIGETGMLIPPNAEFFKQSAERVIRAAQFAARFGFQLSPALIETAREMVPEVLKVPKEQWWRHFEKLLLSNDPARGIRALVWMGLGDHIPGWKELSQTSQDSIWHPEGTVDVHTLMVANVAANLTKGADLDTRRVVGMSSLLHDIAKPEVTEEIEIDGKMRIVSRGHDSRDLIEPKAQAFMDFVGFPVALRSRVINLCVTHMRQAQTPKSVRKLARDLAPATIKQWALLVMSDMAGRSVPEEEIAEGWNSVAKTLALSKEMNVQSSAPQPLVMGRHLIELGVKPGPNMGAILSSAFDAQLDGQFDSTESGVEWLKSNGMV